MRRDGKKSSELELLSRALAESLSKNVKEAIEASCKKDLLNLKPTQLQEAL